jgi:CRP-like cAMP-binding protein
MALEVEQRMAWLRGVPLFRGCSEASLSLLAERTSEVDFEPGQVIVQQGQVGNGLFVLMSGGARITAGAHELAVLGPGEVIGELSVIDQGPRVATAHAVGKTACLALAAWDLLDVLDQDPRLARNLLAELAGRLRDADARLSR